MVVTGAPGDVHQPVGGGHSGGAEEPLGDVLVEGESAAERAGTGIGNASHLEHMLDRAILAAATVEGEEDDIGRANCG